jgi:hypothetical protein
MERKPGALPEKIRLELKEKEVDRLSGISPPQAPVQDGLEGLR